jgi:hypothetical protein
MAGDLETCMRPVSKHVKRHDAELHRSIALHQTRESSIMTVHTSIERVEKESRRLPWTTDGGGRPKTVQSSHEVSAVGTIHMKSMTTTVRVSFHQTTHECDLPHDTRTCCITCSQRSHLHVISRLYFDGRRPRILHEASVITCGTARYSVA